MTEPEQRTLPPLLDGVTVLDLSLLLPGPMAAWHLAELGARVIKVEPPQGDDAARLGVRREGDEASFFYRSINGRKEIHRIDLKSEEGRAWFAARLREADAVIEGFRPGVLERLGWGFEAMRSINPRIVLVSISGYGQDGPMAQAAGHDINYLALAGVLDQTGTAGGPPAQCNLQIADLLGGALHAALAVVAAVHAARRDGAGAHVDLSMTEASWAHLVFPLAQALVEGRSEPRGKGLLTGGVPCYAVYETADGRHLAVGALEEKFWVRLCEAIGRPELIPFHRAVGAEGAKAKAELAAVLRTRTRDEWAAFFAPLDCCVTPVLAPEETLAHPLFRQRNALKTAEEGGPWPRSPLRVRRS
ncbi:MAG: CoA transferase [Rhodocyclales bacterium]|nr:CoA transferase [Rhodocyclales bacterium]